MKNGGNIILIFSLVIIICVLIISIKTTVQEKHPEIAKDNYKYQTILILNHSGDTLLYENGDNIKNVDYYDNNTYIYYNNGCSYMYRNVITILKK